MLAWIIILLELRIFSTALTLGDEMQDWNVLITVYERGYHRVGHLLSEFGPIYRTEYFNVLVMQCDDLAGMLGRMSEKAAADPSILDLLARLIPVTHAFNFQTAGEFETKAQQTVLTFVEALQGKSFHVRMHRRGFKGKISTADTERMLDQAILKSLEDLGKSGRLSFEDPDAIVAVETLGQRAGFSCWSREDLNKYPFLKLT